MNMLDGSHPTGQVTANNEVQSEYNYGDNIVAESGKKSRGGLKSLSELFAPGVELVSGD